MAITKFKNEALTDFTKPRRLVVQGHRDQRSWLYAFLDQRTPWKAGLRKSGCTGDGHIKFFAMVVVNKYNVRCGLVRPLCSGGRQVFCPKNRTLVRHRPIIGRAGFHS